VAAVKSDDVPVRSFQSSQQHDVKVTFVHFAACLSFCIGDRPYYVSHSFRISSEVLFFLSRDAQYEYYVDARTNDRTTHTHYTGRAQRER